MRPTLIALTLAAVLAQPARAYTYKPPSTQTAWIAASADADVERAFAQARTEKKPLMLYWGAEWCPPCNHLKATFFNRQDFIERSRHFVAVHVDGDLPGAQRLGARFKVRGYPTVILFNAEGQELTRLPGEADAPQVMAVLQIGLAGGRPIKAVLADARAGKPLADAEWRLLSYYSWETDEQQLVPEKERAALLASLAAQAKAPDIADRLWLKALANSDDGKDAKPHTAGDVRLRKLLADAPRARMHMDVLVNWAPQLVQAFSGGAERRALIHTFDAALQQLQADTTLSRGDRESALIARVDLARLGQRQEVLTPKLPAALLREVREHVARDEQEVTDGYERQEVITAAGYLLGRAGLWNESDQLLERNLSKSHSPYYLMSQLAGNARKRGDAPRALRWYEQAFDKSEGPATRLEWGARYVVALVELSPQDAPRIEKAAAQLFSEALQDKGAFHERSARSLQRVGRQLVKWNAGNAHAASMQRLRAQLEGVCAKVDAADRATCEAVLKLGA